MPLSVLRSTAVFGFDTIAESCTQNAGVSLASAAEIATCVQQAALYRAERALAIGVPRIGDLLAQSFDVESSGICVPSATGNVDALADPFQAELALRCHVATTLELSKITALNAGAREIDGEFAKLSRPYTSSKAGKLAHAVQYKDAPRP